MFGYFFVVGSCSLFSFGCVAADRYRLLYCIALFGYKSQDTTPDFTLLKDK